MKVKILCRNPDEYIRECKRDIHRVQRNYDPALHPLQAPREYVRALNAVKLERVFAKPFLGSLDGHKDGIECLVKHPKRLAALLSGCCDGEIKLWDIPKKKCIHTIQAHTGFVRGICFHHDSQSFYSVGDDRIIKQWSLSDSDWGEFASDAMNTVIAKTMLTGITHHQNESTFATCGERVDLWDETRAEPVKTYTWGVDSVSCVKFNPVETNLLGSCASDRSIMIYDIRATTPARKVIMKLRSNAICWNPMEAFIFTAANEDHNLYTFDMRNLTRAKCVHQDHTSAVIDVDYSPTGKEFVSGSYDKTLRIFIESKVHSREIYHTKRMQRVKTVLWSLDNKYILCGSDEMNIRLWKANASEKLGVVAPREELSFNYNDKLKEKYANHPQIRRIARHRHVPKHVYNARKERHEIIQAQKRKEANRRAHSKPGSVPFVSECSKHIVEEQE